MSFMTQPGKLHSLTSSISSWSHSPAYTGSEGVYDDDYVNLSNTLCFFDRNECIRVGHYEQYQRTWDPRGKDHRCYLEVLANTIFTSLVISLQ